MNCSGWALPRVFGGLLSARHLVWECGLDRNNRRTETRAGTRGGNLQLTWGYGAGVDLPPSWFIAQSALTANGFVFAAPMHGYVLWTRIDHHLHASMSLEMCFLLSISLSLSLSPLLHPRLSLTKHGPSIYEPGPTTTPVPLARSARIWRKLFT